MLQAVLLILRIIGIVLLCILGVLLLAILAILLIPLRYEGKGRAEGNLKSFQGRFQFSWFFSLCFGRITCQEGKWNYHGRIFFKTIPEDDKEEDASEEDNPAKKVKKHSGIFSRKEKSKKSSKQKFMDKNPKEKPDKKNFIQKIKYTTKTIYDKIKELDETLEKLKGFLKDPVHQTAWRTVKKEIGSLLRYIRPRKLWLNIHFGFEDPSVTGKVLAILSMVYPFYGDGMEITPDFEGAVLDGDFYVKGKIRGIRLLKTGCIFLFDKNVQTTYKHITNWKE